MQWLLQILIVWLLLHYFSRSVNGLSNNNLFLSFYAVGLPIGAGLSFFMCLGFLLGYLKAKMFGPDPVCED